ncbi:MAG: metal ABC transporter solute-binding protein, Zn/Mn family [Solirubrobacteraceae bacterium]
MPGRMPTLAAVACLVLALAGCGTASVHTIGGRVRILAAESFWGSIARQLGGVHATVASVISNPAQDPHSYEPTAVDARAFANAQLTIVNGLSYDPWAPRLLAANPVHGRVELNVGSLLGLPAGANPHRWYDPDDVRRVAGAISAALGRAYPARRAYFAHALRAFRTRGLATYAHLIATIRRRYAGIAVGASESIFALQAPALGLRLLTPPGFMKAVSEGVEPTAQDTLVTERQIREHAIAVWVVNSQNLTPEVQRLNDVARGAGVPIARVTETLTPQTDSFQQWQVAQLRALQAALHRGTGR